MNKPRPLLFSLILILMFMAACAVIFYARTDDKPADAQQTPPVAQTITCQAEAFNFYGYDINGVDYGPGYCIISNQSQIPLYSLLEIDQYGQAQAVASSAELAKDEIRLWYNAPSKVEMFGKQTVKVKVFEKGDMPQCVKP